jgi:hypothetical protein
MSTTRARGPRPFTNARLCRRTASHTARAVQVTPQRAATDFNDFEDYILTLQRNILSTAEQLDGSGAKFVADRWERGSADSNAGSRFAATRGRGSSQSTAS